MSETATRINNALTSSFWSKVDKRGPDECWPWKAALTKAGYGVMGEPGARKTLYAHAVCWEIHNGPRPQLGFGTRGAVVRHTCDNRRCVNPAHLLIGTQADNLRDMGDRLRSTFGQRSKVAKLTDQQALDIAMRLQDGETCAAIAKDYGVSMWTIDNIRRNRTWVKAIDQLLEPGPVKPATEG